MLLFITYKATRLRPGLRPGDLDVGECQTKSGGALEGGGEQDADFILDNLRKPVNHLPSSLHTSHATIPNGATPTRHAHAMPCHAMPSDT